MRTTIDGAGRIVVPKALRDRLGLTGGAEVEVLERDGHLEVVPTPTPVRLVDRGRGLVAVADEPLPPLTDEDVRAAVERVRR